jgi:outer membrane receptor protein involved in Fe transport
MQWVGFFGALLFERGQSVPQGVSFSRTKSAQLRTGMVLVTGLLPLFAGLAAAEATDFTELSLEQLMTMEVTTASKFPQTLREAPSAVAVISAEDIRAYGHRTLADVLRSIPGLYVSDDRNYSYVGARGFSRPGDYNTRLLLLVDGNRLNDGIYDSAMVGTEFILDVDLIERVEFAPGPGSAIYGSNAFFGVINVITRKGKNMNGTELAASAASYQTGSVRVSHGQRTASGLDVLLSASALGSNGQNLYFPEYDSPASNYGIAENLDSDHNKQFFGKIAYRDWSFETGYASRTKDIPTASYSQVFNQPGARTTDKQFFTNLRYETTLTPTLDLQANASYGRYTYDGQYMYGTTNRDHSLGDWWSTELRLLSRSFSGHKLLVGGEYRHDMHRDQENFDVSPYFVYLHDNRAKRAYALYVQDEWAVTGSTLVNLGVRHDGSDTDESSTNPRFALIQKIGASTTGKLLYGSAFRSPNVYEKYYVTDVGAYKQNPDLTSEKINTFELVLEHYLNQDFRVSGSLFTYHIHNLISLTTDPADGLFVFRNLGDVATRGAELRAERVWAGGTRLRASYSRQEAEDEDTGLWLVNSPRHLAKLNVSTPVATGWYSGLELQYVSGRLTPFGNTVGDYTVANLTLRTDRLLKNLDVSASVYNLFDNRYADPPSEEHVDDLGRNLTAIPQNGRNYRLKLNYRF